MHDLLDFTGRARLPMIRQTEAAECGLACLAMVAGYHSYRTDIASIRRKHAISLKGLSLHALMTLAERFHLSARAVRLDLDELSDLKLPAILHWDLDHFVVLKAVGRRSLTLHDPARGPRKLRMDEASRHFTGVALELRPAEGFQRKKETEKLPLSAFWKDVKGLKRFLIHAFILAGLLQLFALASPFYTQLLIDEALEKMDAELIGVLALGFGLVLLLQTVTSVIRRYVGLYLGNQLNFQLVGSFVHHLIRLPAPWFAARHLGDILSRFGSLGQVQSVFTTGLVSGVLNIVAAALALTLLFAYSVKLTALVLAVLAVYLLLRLALFRYARQLQADKLVADAREDSVFMETIRGIQPIKLFSREVDRESQWQNVWADAVNLGIRNEKLGIWTATANTFLFGVQNILVLYFGAHEVLAGSFTIGMLMAYTSYKAQFESAAIALVDGLIRYKLLDLHLERLADIGLAEPEEGLGAGAPRSLKGEAPPLAGRITLENVSFRYGEGEPWVVNGVSLEIAPGEMVVFVGPSGQGKTTLLKIMLALFTPETGELRIDGQPIEQYGRAAYRAQVGAVMQEDALLSGSIADNISFFDPEPDMPRIQHCAELASIHEEIAAMPMGYDSLIGDMGTVLSGGQKQRVLLARALYREPRALFLDEGTANLDPASERRILDLLESLDITRVCVAHREAVMRCADRIFRVQAGHVTEIDKADALQLTPQAAE